MQGMRSEKGLENRRKYLQRRNQLAKRMWAKCRHIVVDVHKWAVEATPAVEQLYQSTCPTVMSKAVASVLYRAMEALLDDDEARVHAILAEQGARHYCYNAPLGAMLPRVLPVMVRHCKEELGNKFTRVDELELTRVWTTISKTLLDGAAIVEKKIVESNAPKTAPMCVMFTDIERSTHLWDNYKVAMMHAVDVHHRILREEISRHYAYEVKTIGDSFMIACQSVADALKLAVAVQLCLHECEWMPDILNAQFMEGGGDPECWNGIRVRIGLHYCANSITPKFDAVHQHFDYYGPGINLAARVENSACGGQILISGQYWEAAQAEAGHDAELESFISGLDVDLAHSGVVVKGVAKPVEMYSVLPKKLAGRVFLGRN